MIFYLTTNIIFALTLTLIIFLIAKLPIKVQVSKKRLVTRIEKQLSANYNYFKAKQKSLYDGYIENIIRHSGIRMSLSTLYLISFISSIGGGMVGYLLKFPFLILLLTSIGFFIPLFAIYLIGAYQSTKSYKTTFKVLHTAEKASQLTNSPLIVFRKILPYLCQRDRKYFNRFLINFDANKPYLSLFDELEKRLSNSYLKELVINGRETANGINYNHSIRLMIDGYNKNFELLEHRKRNINSMVLLLYILSLSFVVFSIYIVNNYMLELQNTLVAQLFFKTTMITVILSVVLASIALINVNQH